MRLELKDMLCDYLKRERTRAVSEAVEFKKLALEEFFVYLDNVKEEYWDIDDAIRGRTLRDYITYLETKSKEPNYILNAFKSVNDFIMFAMEMGWVKENEVWKQEKDKK